MKPWVERERWVAEILREVQVKLSNITGLQIFAAQPAALPGGSNFPIEFIITATEEPEKMLPFAQKLQAKAAESGILRVDDLNPGGIPGANRVAPQGRAVG